MLPSIEGYKFVDQKGETPLHIAIKPHYKREVSIKVLAALLDKNLVSCVQKDKSNNKRPIDYLKSDDPRFEMLQRHMEKSPSKPMKKKKKKSKDGESTVKRKLDEIQPILDNKPKKDHSEDDSFTLHTQPSVKEVHYKDLSMLDKVTYHIEMLLKKDVKFIIESEIRCEEGVKINDHTSSMHALIPKDDQVSRFEAASNSCTGSTCKPLKTSSKIEQVVGATSENSYVDFTKLEQYLEGLHFDDLLWEVEVTKSVVKFFKNTKKYSPVERISAARVLFQIAEGKRNKHLCKQVSSNPDVCLYEARISKSGRILWEKAISYSSKLTGDSSCPVYTKVIRVWKVVLNHDDLDKKIKSCLDKVEKSIQKGLLATVSCGLDDIDQKSGRVRGQDILDKPSVYVKQCNNSHDSKHCFFPAASAKETEYNVTTFYSFDSMAVKSMIAGTNNRRDYPFKEWQKEHEIIKIKSREAILLLGRSGTGKTTCCLYRLWNEFRNQWDPSSKTYQIKIPRKCLTSTSCRSPEENGKFKKGKLEDDTDSNQHELDLKDKKVECSEVQESKSVNLSASTNVNVMEMIEENLHQIFVTKNYTLCNHMKRSFYNMVAAYDFLNSHLSYEVAALPNSLGQVEDLSFPLFITARQFYILLDNSLQDGNNFFKRDDDGNLQVKILSMDYDDEKKDLLLDLKQNDPEDEEFQVAHSTLDQPAQKQQTTNWTVVTARYFKEVVWDKISHQHKVKDLDPMLVWLEIQSFIKGSEHAVEKGSPLSLTEYQETGNRMAPNFSGHRELIYKLYRSYQSYIKNQRYGNYLFDECDLILNLHQRLKKVKDVSWSIHSVYIDEVQDFTQAELAIFIHCCRDPNSMFFTGDTAQSIMRGIAFRFKDLRSCFHKLNQNLPSILVPQEPLNLTINYRSHSGILKLAGTVIDLIKQFFRNSIDHLPDDEGMFPGPVPVFIESCKEEDLSLLLSSNKRKCSAIEFGAHQVILVQSKQERDRLPEILKSAIILTILEAKGLEFDDVLLYNFFSDSMVSLYLCDIYYALCSIINFR